MPVRGSLFYGWVVVAVMCVVMILVYGVRHSFSVFFPPILDEFGWGRGETAVMLSLHLFFYGLAAPVIGTITDWWHPRRILLIGTVILSSAAALCSLATQLWHFYLIFGLVTPIGLACCGSPVVNPTIANWFSKNRGLALGVAQMGGGLSFVYVVYPEFIMSIAGWRTAYVAMGVTMLIILIPLVHFFYRYHPREKGLIAHGLSEPTPDKPETQENAVQAKNQEWTLSAAVRTPQLWLMVLSQTFFWGTGCYLILAHVGKFAQDAGYSGLFAASMFALYGVSMVVGQLSAAISDWIGREVTVVIATGLCVVGLAVLLSVVDNSEPWRLYFYAISFGLGAGLQAPTIFAGAADLFYGRHFGSINGVVLAGMGFGGAIGPWVGGYLYDLSGTYQQAIILSAATFIVAAITFFFSAPRKGISPPTLR